MHHYKSRGKTLKSNGGIKWKVEQEQKKWKNVIQQRDELIETMKELNNALRAKENESKSYSNSCKEYKDKVENLESSLQKQSNANIKLAEMPVSGSS